SIPTWPVHVAKLTANDKFAKRFDLCRKVSHSFLSRMRHFLNARREQTAILLLLAAVAALLLFSSTLQAETFRVATYNIENYLDAPTQTRSAKSAEARANVRDSILAIQPDVLALQEIGSADALLELRRSLKEGGLDLPHWE